MTKILWFSTANLDRKHDRRILTKLILFSFMPAPKSYSYQRIPVSVIRMPPSSGQNQQYQPQQNRPLPPIPGQGPQQQTSVPMQHPLMANGQPPPPALQTQQSHQSNHSAASNGNQHQGQARSKRSHNHTR